MLRVPEITFIVCTRNRATSLPHALNSIAAEALSYGDGIDLVVVDNGSTDNTRKIIEDWAASAPLPVHLVCETRPGLAAARNAGVAAATGTLLAFTDDDCALAP